MIEVSKDFGIQVIALAEIKLGEKSTSEFVKGIRKWMDGGSGWMNNAAWCACFASWCIAQVSDQEKRNRIHPNFGATVSYFEWFKRNDLLLAKPVDVCLGMIRGHGGGPATRSHHHTFLVKSVDGEFVNGIDGNWSDQVSHTRHKISDCDFGPIV